MKRMFITYWKQPWSLKKGKLDGRRKEAVRKVLKKLDEINSHEFFDLTSTFCRRSVSVFKVPGTGKLEIYYTLGIYHKYLGYRIVVHCDKIRNNYVPFSVFGYDGDRNNTLVYNY